MFDRRIILAGGLAAAGFGTPVFAAPMTDQIDRIDGVVAEFGFNGVVLLGDHGRATFRKAYGLADAETNRPASPADRYVIASISKWLTVAAVLRLVEQGTMRLDMTVADGLPSFRDRPGGRVALHQLLSNTSGIPNLFGPAVRADPALTSSTLSAAQAADAFCSGELIFEPGARFDYALTNWILVIALVEAAAGRPFERVVDDLVVTPLRLRDTGVAGDDFADRPDTAKAYATLVPPTLKMARRPAFLAAAGGFCSTADDLLRAAWGVFDTPLLTPISRAEMLTVRVPEQHYALGGRVASLTTPQGVRSAAWETGRTEGYRSVLAHVLDDKRTVVLLNNTDLSQQTMDRIALRLLDADWA
ncbi:serine hydrolase domain-containing protein [Brevundimonas sp.]|jgi:D-alanyl-D-alanine carboxypeptidase|uniref:serine hydrolase domain-containing protein n=1 Tax=Brevundimonas sp. TaxID=1871086 RepID=UPI0037BE5A21